MAKTILEAGYGVGGVTSINTTQYWGILGTTTTSVTTETQTQNIFRLAGTLTGLFVRLTANTLGAGNSTITIRKNGAAGSGAVSINGSATGAFEDTTGSDSIAAGDLVCIETDPGSTTGIMTISLFSTIFDATADTVTKLAIPALNMAGASTTYYQNVAGDVGGTTTTEANAKLRIRKAGSMQKASVYVITARATATTIRSRKNGANGNVTISVTGATTGRFEDTSNSDTLAAGDDWCWQIVTGTGTDTPLWRQFQIDFVSTGGDGLLVISDSRGVAITEPTTNYYVLGGRLVANTTSTNRGTKARNTFDFSELVTFISANGVAAGTTIALNVNGTDSALGVSIGSSATGLFVDSTDTISMVATDDLMYKMVTPATGGTPTITLTYIAISTHLAVAGTNYTAVLPTETVSISESVARLYAANRATATETVTVSESLVRLADHPRAMATETVTIGESLARVYGVVRPLPTETVTVGESIARVATTNRALAAQTVTVSETLARQFTGSRALSPETTTIGETLTTLKTIVRTLATETVVIGESLVRSFNGVRLLPAETITATGTLTRVYSAMRSLATETVTVGSESLTRLYGSMRALATETVIVTAGTLARLLGATRALATETVTASEILLRQFVGQRLLAAQTTVISDSVATLYTAAPPAGTFERQMPLENVAITESLNRVVTNSRTLPEITAISESITRVYGTTRTMATQTVPITESLVRVYGSTRALPAQVVNIAETQSRLCNTARTLSETIPITESLLRTYSGVRTLSTEIVTIGESLVIFINPAIIIPSVWRITGKDTDFPDSIENLIMDYIKTEWSITEPIIGPSPIITNTSRVQTDNFAYDTYRTYYIRVKEVGNEVNNREIRANTFEFETPVQLELYSRRLKKGQAFLQLNNMVNELLRIFGTYLTGLFGIEGITLNRITSMEKERPAAKTIWSRRLSIILHYYKMSIIG